MSEPLFAADLPTLPASLPTATTVSAAPPPPPAAAPGCAVGRVAGVGPGGVPLVEWAGRPAAPARSTVPVTEADLGRDAVLVFEDGLASRPVILGLLQAPAAGPAPVAVECDGHRLVLRAEREIELRCGEASLVLTRAGKVLVRGAYVSTRSTGVTRIKGAAVQIN